MGSRNIREDIKKEYYELKSEQTEWKLSEKL